MKSTNHDNYNKQPLAESVSLKIVRKRFWRFALIAMAVLLLSSITFGQTGTLTDDAYTSTNSNVQSGNFSGKGPAIEPKIVRHHTTALARGHVLVHLKAESGHVPKGPDLLAVHTSATTLGAVLKQP